MLKSHKRNPFENEKLRSQLAKRGHLEELRGLYNSSLKEIPDNNSASLWDNINFSSDFSYQNNAIAWDKLHTVRDSLINISGKVLNVGFGSANLESLILPVNKKVNWYGIDISPKSVKVAKKSFSRYGFKIGSILDIRYRNSTFDCVIALEVLEHIRPKFTFKAFSEISRVLKPGGVLVISVPLNEELEKMISMQINPNAHVRIYTKDLLKSELKLAGFRTLKVHKFYAFRKHYLLKKLITKCVPFIKKPNNLLIFSEKP